jgi:hypothetical protein
VNITPPSSGYQFFIWYWLTTVSALKELDDIPPEHFIKEA